MTLSHFFSSVSNLKNLPSLSWKPTGRLQRTLLSSTSRSGTGLHSGRSTTAKLYPAMAGEGRYFVTRDGEIPASIQFVEESALCTTVSRDGATVRTVEHLLSALEATGVDNCRIHIEDGDEVPLLDGSARQWVEAIEQVGLRVAKDGNGNTMDKLAPVLHKPVHVWKGDAFIAASPSSRVRVTYEIDFPKVPAIGCQRFSCSPMDENVYAKEISPSRTFCIFEEVGKLFKAGIIQGGSAANASVCSASLGWLNPPLHFADEPCRHKVLDLIGDLSLFAQNGNQGLPIAHIHAHKAGHALHGEFVRCLSELSSNAIPQDALEDVENSKFYDSGIS